MKCYIHNGREAVGICKSCGKGLCTDCAIDLGKGLACREQCEETVSRLIDLIDQNTRYAALNRNMMGNVRRNTLMQAAFTFALGGLFLAFGWRNGELMGFTGFMGMALLGYGVYGLQRGFRLPREE